MNSYLIPCKQIGLGLFGESYLFEMELIFFFFFRPHLTDLSWTSVVCACRSMGISRFGVSSELDIETFGILDLIEVQEELSQCGLSTQEECSSCSGSGAIHNASADDSSVSGSESSREL